MAIHHLDVSIISRGKGHSVIAAAAYRAGVRLIDERTGEVHDYTRRSGVDGAPILAPAGAEPWTQDRSTLWNAAEKAESRRDAQLARSWVLALPRELDPAMNKQLGRELFERHLVSRGMVVDLYFHDLDGENPHAHALSVMRPLDGIGANLFTPPAPAAARSQPKCVESCDCRRRGGSASAPEIVRQSLIMQASESGGSMAWFNTNLKSRHALRGRRGRHVVAPGEIARAWWSSFSTSSATNSFP